MGWDKDRPVGAQPFKAGDDAIRENFEYIETALAPWMEFGPGSANDGRPKAPVGALPGSPKQGYYALNPTIPGLLYRDASANRALYGIPVGVVTLWTGSVTAIPDGWWQCCSYHATLAPKGAAGLTKNGVVVPDFGASFLVGLDPAESDYDSVGETGGSPDHVVTEANIEQFDATPASQVQTGIANTNVTVSGGTPVDSASTPANILVGTVGATPIDHRPPFYVACYIVFCAV